ESAGQPVMLATVPRVGPVILLACQARRMVSSFDQLMSRGQRVQEMHAPVGPSVVGSNVALAELAVLVRSPEREASFWCESTPGGAFRHLRGNFVPPPCHGGGRPAPGASA